MEKKKHETEKMSNTELMCSDEGGAVPVSPKTMLGLPVHGVL